MALINTTSFVGFLILLYLSSFVLLAIFRIVTGISIQRFGLSSLRHISYTPKEGFRIDIRGLGLAVHSPTFAQPTWVSLRLQDLTITVEPSLLHSSSTERDKGWESESEKDDAHGDFWAQRKKGKVRSRLWKRLSDVKEKAKRIHRKIHWLRMLDIYATNTTFEVVGAGSLSIGSLTLAVHTRRKLLDRGRLFRHKMQASSDQRPAEWIFTTRSILFGLSGREPIEILDTMSVNVHGLLYKDKEGLRDTSIAVKVGRLHIPVDEILDFKNHAKQSSAAPRQANVPPTSPGEEISFDAVVDELERPGSREAAIVQTVADSKEFLGSVLRGVQEIQLGMSFIRVSKEVESLKQANLPVVMNIVTHEIGIDLHRMPQNSPAHRMYFKRHDVAHQALLAAVSISLSLDEDDVKTKRIMYIPMATTTMRTTLPSKTMDFTEDRNVEERNSNVLFSNLVISSPAIDLSPQHMIQLLAVAQRRTQASSDPSRNHHRLISRLLPRASIKLSIHEPVVRFVLPVADPKYKDPEDYDMIISAISSVSLDIESSHSLDEDLLYSLSSNFRLVSHRLYYQAAAGNRHNLLTTESLELKADVTASSEVFVIISGALRNFAVLMVRDEVSKGVYNIVRHFKRNVEPEKLGRPPAPAQSFLRKFPTWLLEFHFEGTNCSVETAGIDHTISKQTRGVAFELESWTADYLAHRSETDHRPSSRRRISAAVRPDEPPSNFGLLSPPYSPSRHRHLGQYLSHHTPTQAPSDGRRLAIHVKGFQGFIIESLDVWEQKPFMLIPRTEVAFSTSRDSHGPIFHIKAHIRTFYMEFSLYRVYSIGIAGSAIEDALLGSPEVRFDRTPAATSPAPEGFGHSHSTGRTSTTAIEVLSLDIKAAYVQVKASMPHDPPMMLQLYDLATGRHRWSSPFLRCGLIRLHAESPHIRSAWARIVSMSNIRVDLRHAKKKTIGGTIEERSVEIVTDFIRIGVPHGLRMYKIFDNFINTFKSMAQLAYRFKTRTNDYILKKEPEGPKLVPRISLRSKALMFELEDDAFEWKLSNIYHVGRTEQKQRMARADAFRLKVRKLREDKGGRSSSRRRAQSSRRASREQSPSTPNRRSRSQDSTPRRRSVSRGRDGRSQRLRYDRDGTCQISGSSKIHANEAWQKLQEYNAHVWKTRIDYINDIQSKTVRNIRRMFSGADEPPPEADDDETVLGIPERPGLLTIIISDLHLLVDKPSFPMSNLPKFMSDIGKGIPHDMQYALLIPMNIALDMGEARFMLRDYPLNLLHIPAIRPGQPPRLPSWSLKSDFVIAEEFRDDQSIRHVQVEVVPKGQRAQDGTEIPGFAIDVRRTVSPVKTFSKPVIDINTSAPTSISWGTSYQPAIQDAMLIIESFTKPEIDPSDRVGFWDKIRLSFHSRPIVNWKGDGDVQLRLKGSRDPYNVTGYGAGFVMCWRNNVRWAIHEDDDPKRFMTVQSGEYVLAVPDFSHKARRSPEHAIQHETDSTTSASSYKNAEIFKKVIMKVSGNVQWTAGLVFEQDMANGARSSDFKPHYDVVLKNPKYMTKEQLHNYDAYQGFRSQHIHMSITLAAPFDKNWTATDTLPSQSYNSVHLSPRFFSHFFNWWSLFSGIMSLPIRQGPLWRGPEKTSKKFGRHLATIKYGLLLSPLFIAHIYKHKDSEDYKEDVVSATGLKLRLNSFIFDVHQRREWFNTLSKSKSEQMRTSAMKIHQAELDFVHADLRAVAANIAGTTADELKRATDEMLSSFQDVPNNVDLSKFTIPDHDFSWIDMDDFVEMDWILPAESNPDTKILPLAFTPRFTYFRQTDHDDSIHGDGARTSPFGDEDTHYCMMPSKHNDPRKVQMNLIETRLDNLEEQIQAHGRLMGEHELKIIRDGDPDKTLEQDRQEFHAQEKELQGKKVFLQHGLKRLGRNEYPGEVGQGPGETPSNTSIHETEGSQPNDSRNSVSASVASTTSHAMNGQVDMDGLYSAPHDEFASDFNNRFIVHNAQVKWNNSLRNIILRYSHQVSQRRGFVYYMSRRAVKFILDIVDEQAKRKEMRRHGMNPDNQVPPTPSVTSPSDEKDEENVVEDRIQQLLSDAKRFVNEDEESSTRAQAVRRASTISVDPEEKLVDDFEAMNSYHIRLIAPQIQFQSEKNTPSVVLLTAKGMQLKVVSIMDKARLSDDVSGLVQRRFALDMDGVQIFVTSLKKLSKYIHLYSSNRYGNAPGSSWPPWASIEAMFDFQLDPFGFTRVIQKTSASLRYEKYNALRLKYNEQVAKDGDNHSKHSTRQESRIDHLWVDFPRLRASCDSQQYYTMYIIVLDLLMYTEPLEKTRTERLEKIMLASDFSDLRGAPEMAQSLQERIRQLEDLKLHFMINAKYLDKQGWQDRIDLEKDLSSCEDELFFIMKAINTSQQRNDERSSQSSGFLRWYLSASQIVWHLMREKNEPLLEFQLGNATYERIDNSDGSNHNAMEIEHIRGLNLLTNAIYPEIIGPFNDPQQKLSAQEPKMLQLHWFMLEAIAGIPVLEEFQVTMHPLKVQLERQLGKALFEYIFPGIGSSAFDHGSFSPLMVKNMKPVEGDNDEENEQARNIVSPAAPLQVPNNDDMRSTSPGAMGRRLQPTYNLRKVDAPPVEPQRSKHRGLGIGAHRIGLFSHSNHSEKDQRSTNNADLRRKSSSTSVHSFRRNREDSSPSINGDSSKDQVSRTQSRERKRFGLQRHDSFQDKEKNKKASDDVSQMLSRASNFMTLAHVKLNSVVICLSYKGQRDRNFEDLHDFVFRMPTLEYRNKTWSNLDLALHLKKDVIRALISHTGAIIGNKLSHRRPGKKQAERLREIAAGNALIPNSETLMNTPSEGSEVNSLYSFTQESGAATPRISLQSDSNANREGTRKLEPSPLLRSGSWSSFNDHRTKDALSIITTSDSGRASNDASRTEHPLKTGHHARAYHDYPGHNGSSSNARSSNLSLPPDSSPSRIDPLGPINSVLPRPSTSHSNFIPAKSLLKDVVGRHFSGSNDITGLRPTIHKGRVRFTSSHSFNSDKSGGHSRRNSTGGKFSEGEKDNEDDDAVHTEPDTPESNSTKKKGVLHLGRRVLDQLREKEKDRSSS